MASRDPRADIVENNPFPKPKIHRIHSNQDSNNSTIYTMVDLKSMFFSQTNLSDKVAIAYDLFLARDSRALM